MKTFIFDICFICTNSNTIKTINKEYKAINKQKAIDSIKEYCDNNNTMQNCTINLLDERK